MASGIGGDQEAVIRGNFGLAGKASDPFQAEVPAVGVGSLWSALIGPFRTNSENHDHTLAAIPLAVHVADGLSSAAPKPA